MSAEMEIEPKAKLPLHERSGGIRMACLIVDALLLVFLTIELILSLMVELNGWSIVAGAYVVVVLIALVAVTFRSKVGVLAAFILYLVTAVASLGVGIHLVVYKSDPRRAINGFSMFAVFFLFGVLHFVAHQRLCAVK